LSERTRVSDGSELFPEVRWLHSASATCLPYVENDRPRPTAYWIMCPAVRVS